MTEAIILGGFRAKGLPSGAYSKPSSCSANTNRTPSVSAVVYAYPFLHIAGQTFDRMGVGLVTAQAGAACRIGAYTEVNGLPSALIVDGGELTLSSGSGLILATISQYLASPFWVLVWMKDVATQATMNGPSIILGHFVGESAGTVVGTTGAPNLAVASAYPGSMPSTAPAVGIASGTAVAPMPFLRAA